MIFVVPIEPIDTRYTRQWYDHIPKLLDAQGVDVTVIEGDDVPAAPTPGAFLDFGATNIYKSSQLMIIAQMFREGKVQDGDRFLFTDAWNPTVIQLRYMAELLGKKIEIHGMWHAGSYDPQDFLGRLIGDKPWVRNAESSMFYCYDHNWFATRFHANMFLKELFDVRVLFGEDELDEWNTATYPGNPEIGITGWPMEYMEGMLAPFRTVKKRNKIIFPHRIAPEKQVEIFRDLANSMPEYEWFVAQDQRLTKDEYHTHLAESRIVFSANLQETLGISMYEGALVGAYPLVPDRLSYSEMWLSGNLYPSEWTDNWDLYLQNKQKLMNAIQEVMNNSTEHLAHAAVESADMASSFFDSSTLIDSLTRS